LIQKIIRIVSSWSGEPFQKTNVTRSTLRTIKLPKPVQSDLKLYGIDSGIWDRQSGVRDVLKTDARSKGASIIVEELKAQGRMR
jgi:hypothetical protein